MKIFLIHLGIINNSFEINNTIDLQELLDKITLVLNVYYNHTEYTQVEGERVNFIVAFFRWQHRAIYRREHNANVFEIMDKWIIMKNFGFKAS